MGLRDIILDMVKNHAGVVSSKIVIGAITYILLTISIIVLMFVNAEFPGITEIVITLILTSGGLLGLTTIENIKQKKSLGEDDKEEQIDEDI